MSETVDDALLRTLPLPAHDADADKDERGRVLAVGGSRAVPGALLLAGVAALRAGAGKLQLATVESLAPHLGLAVPEALVFALPELEGEISPAAAGTLAPRVGRCDALLVGPGMLDEDGAGALAAALLDGAGEASVVLDAAALTGLRDRLEVLRARSGPVVMTPHAGEMARLLGCGRDEIVADPQGVACRFARENRVVVALKGADTVIAHPDGRSWIYRDGRVGLATSGSGDTLAGVVAGLLARGAEAHRAAIWGVYLHGEAGNRLARSQGPLGFLARELLAEVPQIMAGFGGAAP